jgi:predicted Rossmann fold nucleotide-binding protein DprA/Smf involved in DNA uptake
MEKLVKPNPKKGKKKKNNNNNGKLRETSSFQISTPRLHHTSSAKSQTKGQKLCFPQATKDQIPRTLELHMKKRREGASKKKKMYPPKYKKILDTRPTHSLTHSLPKDSQRSSQFNNNNNLPPQATEVQF